VRILNTQIDAFGGPYRTTARSDRRTAEQSSRSQEFEQLIDGQAGFVQDFAERSGAEDFVIWNNDPSVGRLAAQYDVTAALPLHFKADSSQGLDPSLTRKIDWQFGHRALVVTSTYSRLSSTGMGSPAARTSSR
jgi:hypothetical protein